MVDRFSSCFTTFRYMTRSHSGCDTCKVAPRKLAAAASACEVMHRQIGSGMGLPPLRRPNLILILRMVVLKLRYLSLGGLRDESKVYPCNSTGYAPHRERSASWNHHQKRAEKERGCVRSTSRSGTARPRVWDHSATLGIRTCCGWSFGHSCGPVVVPRCALGRGASNSWRAFRPEIWQRDTLSAL